MTCSHCQETGVYNEVLGRGFYYCRTCKNEIALELAPEPIRLTQEEIDQLFMYIPNSTSDDVVY